MITADYPPRTALFLPASNPRAIEKAYGIDVDLLILDLEDAVKPDDKDRARAAAVDAAASMAGRSLAIRVNGLGTIWHADDLVAVAASAASHVVLPKAEDDAAVTRFAVSARRPVLAMIETPAGVLASTRIAALPGVAGLIAGTNDLRAALRIPESASRDGLSLGLQTIVLAARAGGCFALDGVFNALGDAVGLSAECRAGRAMGFDGKTLIHPNQIEIAADAFGPDAAEIEDARALIAAASGGAERFRDRMIETMHLDQARALLRRAGP